MFEKNPTEYGSEINCADKYLHVDLTSFTRRTDRLGR
jgi:hypothetical protein